MSSHDLSDKWKKNFKGVENFLRRVAFNLGNSPSQTEVKIISCIPIDVTDLQQKVVALEKQLEGMKERQPCPESASGEQQKQQPVIQAAIYQNSYSHLHLAQPPVMNYEQSQSYNDNTFNQYSEADNPHFCPDLPTCECWSSDATRVQSNQPVECRKGFFRKRKKKKEKFKKEKCKAPLVYYAQASNSPFKEHSEKKKSYGALMTDTDVLGRKYISTIIRKQYTPVPVMQQCSLESDFSSPVCRDIEQNLIQRTKRDDDMCSCCYGPFHNIDDHLPTRNFTNEISNIPTHTLHNASFYDASFYDMVPVKERDTKVIKPYNKPKTKSPNSNNVVAAYIPEMSRSQRRVYSYDINYCNRGPSVVNYSKRMPARMHSNKKKVHRIPPKREIIITSQPPVTSNSCCIDCGDVYMKCNVIGNDKPKQAVETVLRKNVECLTNICNDMECQTTTTQSVQIDQDLEDNRTEETLNQIKTMLQSVLTEIKTSSQVKNISKDKQTKDAVVQKISSQDNMPGCSSIMHSYTYNPYNMNPYVPSCSRQMWSDSCYPSVAKCLHNFPVFIQTPPRHMCGYYRNSSKVGQAKNATTATTNTETNERSKETDKLIKEIYKTIAVNMEIPRKETSASECNDCKCSPQAPKTLDEGLRKFMMANASRNEQKSETPLSSLETRLMSSTTNQRPDITDTERRLRNHQIENYLDTVEARKRQNMIEEERDYEDDSETTASEEDSSSDAEESVASKGQTKKSYQIQIPEPNKKSLMSKMFKSVKLFRNRAKKEENVQVGKKQDEESEANSEDYQTVYSQRSDRKHRYVPYPVHAVRSPPRLKAHSKISYSRHMRDRNQERLRKPYMEQEYRRQWNERFHENSYKCLSEEPQRRHIPRRPNYWQNIEARSAVVRHKAVTDACQTNPHTMIVRDQFPSPDKATKHTSKGLAWLTKHKLGIKCGPQWKKFLKEG